MIRPNMATMLGYIATDAKVSRDVLQALVRDAANKSFNRITIGDASTNDCCMLIATGQAPLAEIASASGELFGKLREAVFAVFMEHAQAIVRDGEGATKFRQYIPAPLLMPVTVTVTPSCWNCRLAPLGRVSVVMMPVAASAQ